MGIMDNVIIKNPVVIKDVKLTKEELEKFKEGKNQIGVTEVTLFNEIEAEKDKVKGKQKALDNLLQEKKDLQALIARGTVGLTSNLLDTQKKIREAEVELKETEESLTGIENLKKEQMIFLESSLYNQFMENGKLVKEFNKNAEALQLQYYSAMYKAFEVANKLRDLEKEYHDSANYAFRNAYPYKSFSVTFPSDSFINEARNNFKQPTMHFSAWSPEHVEKFVRKFEGIEENKDFILYK